MNNNEKLDYIYLNCHPYEDVGYFCISTESMVGQMAARLFRAKTERECLKKVIDYLDREKASNKNTLVKDILHNINW